MASRVSSGKVLNQVGQAGPLAAGRLGRPGPLDPHAAGIRRRRRFQPGSYGGRNFHFGIREHAMGADLQRHGACAACGLTAPTFFVFTDYMRPSMRLAAIMGLPVLYVFTHDSIGVGEDGPTHQPIEQLAALRAIPNLVVIRPGDANEVTEAYRVALG